MHCAKFCWNWPSGSGEEDENVESLRQRRQQRQRRTTDKFWSEKLTWALGSDELKANVLHTFSTSTSEKIDLTHIEYTDSLEPIKVKERNTENAHIVWFDLFRYKYDFL